jgi:hypothetical protein
MRFLATIGTVLVLPMGFAALDLLNIFTHVQVAASQKLLDQFLEGNKLLDSVQKGLANYLETKRLAFARY